ncbi:hypothetical protein [Enterovirga aerilata]|uniref:Yip1 domain-containing protein n=1 Tax=Enterovirga aerilata TaxID=2730920 RepID=A0A849I858_9HYPH|nr:hypothetical protein [Enterovirga sp. DB1703]NNM73964.1 hypothetical protein [Enterovirga sp. DB1703]
MVTVEEVGRSLRGTAALVSRQPDALSAFDISREGLVRSFAAFAFTIPALVVTVALERRGLGLDIEGLAVFDRPALLCVVAAAHLASLAALQVAMAYALRRGPLAPRYAAFAIATNWIAVFGSLALAAPAALFLMGLEPRGLVALLTLAFGAIVLEAQWFAAKVTLGVSSALAGAVALLGLSLQVVIHGVLRTAIG